MTKALGRYLTGVRSQYKLFPNWLPSEAVNLGDYGILENNIFKRRGNIKDEFKIKIRTATGVSTDYEYSNDSTISLDNNVNINAGSTGFIPCSKFTISFSSEAGVLFKSANTKIKYIKNYQEVADNLFPKAKSGEWKSNYVLVNKIIDSDNTMLVLSQGKGSSLELSTSIPKLGVDQIFDPNVRLNIQNESNIGFKMIANKNAVGSEKAILSPLIGLSRFSYNLYSKRDAIFDEITPKRYYEFFDKFINAIKTKGGKPPNNIRGRMYLILKNNRATPKSSGVGRIAYTKSGHEHISSSQMKYRMKSYGRVSEGRRTQMYRLLATEITNTHPNSVVISDSIGRVRINKIRGNHQEKELMAIAMMKEIQ